MYAKKCNNFVSLETGTVFILYVGQTDPRTEIDIRLLPETLLWLVHAQWDAAECERSDYLMSPSHQSELGHPKI